MSLTESMYLDAFNDSSPWTKLKNLGIDIGDFIMPMVYAGIIDRVIWIKPTWERYSIDGKEIFQVGNLKGHGEEFTCNSGDLLFATGKNTPLENEKTVEFTILTLGKITLKDLNIEASRTLLDIDLDYFSTSNPARTVLKREFKLTDHNVTELARSFAFENLCFPDSEIPDQYRISFKSHSKEAYNQVLKAIFLEKHLFRHFPKKFRSITSDEDFLEKTTIARRYWCDKNATEQFLLTKHFLDSAVHKDLSILTQETNLPSDIRDILKYARFLPNHILSQKEILDKIQELSAFLEFQFSSPPAITTVVKSESDSHTPSRLVNFLLENVYLMLQKVFLDKNYK